MLVPRPLAAALLALALAACSDSGTAAGPAGPTPPAQTPPDEAAALPVSGLGRVSARYTSELWVHGDWAYTGTWGRRGAEGNPGNMLYVWNVARSRPVLRDSVVIGAGAVVTLGDVQASDDGRLLIVATEANPHGSLRVFTLDDPARPRAVGVYNGPEVRVGVHTAELARVDGTLYAFLSVPGGSHLVVLDLSDPAAPRRVLTLPTGDPVLHDVYVRDGLLFTADWHGGVGIWDIGGGGRGGTVAAPVPLGRAQNAGGFAHNTWWPGRDAQTIDPRYLFIGEEGPSSLGVSSSGDIHVMDISDPASPREVAFLHVPGAGTHNFSVDERRGILYAAYYNAGVRALDVRGDLSDCADSARDSTGRCDLARAGRVLATGLADRETFVWGVHQAGQWLYASDMLNGLWKLDVAGLRP